MLIYKEQVHWFLEKDLEEGSRPGRGGGGEGGRAGAEQTPRAAQEAVAGAGVAGQAQQAEEAAGPGAHSHRWRARLRGFPRGLDQNWQEKCAQS